MHSQPFALTRFFLLFLLINGGIAFTEESDGMINHRPISIQTLPMTAFSSWPETDNSPPVEIRALSERLWLIWPGAVVSLSLDAKADEQTLLSLFSSGTAAWGEDSWSPAGGTLCTDGIWRGQAEKGTALRTLNLQTGETDSLRTSIPASAELHPIPMGRILVRSGPQSFILLPDGSQEPVPFTISPLSILTLSPRIEYAALFNVLNRNLNVESYAKRSNKTVRIDTSSLPPTPPWTTAWMEKTLVVGYPGQLILFSLDNFSAGESEEPFFVLEESWIPNQWYQLHGAGNRLILHSPGENLVKIITFGTESPEPLAPLEYTDVLQQNAVKAGEYLLYKKRPVQAGLYYTWVLAQIRNFRSLQPLSTIWPRMEKDIVDKRAALGNR